MDQTGLQANIAILFSESEGDGQFLNDFGFGDGILQHLKEKQSYEVPRPINLNDVILYKFNLINALRLYLYQEISLFMKAQ